MLSITYVGPHAEGVEVPALGALVLPGETIEVDDDDLALNLLEQADNWQPVSASAASKKRHAHEVDNEQADTPKDGE